MTTSRLLLYTVGWLVAVALAVTVGVVAVTRVGDSMRDRGPISSEQVRVDGLADAASPEPVASATALVQESFSGDYGEFVVGCQGVYAIGVAARPAEGWQVLSYEPGPDDDVDALFSQGARSVELEVFCNGGRPTLAELEAHELAED